ncbi:CRISPR-associated protein, Cse2 family [Actinobacteria bacterium OK074]|nr:CRISPR-associated protein, Cse2 family [Actinobacteria bacterium OK074]
MTERKKPAYWWEKFSPTKTPHAGAALAALRRGIGQEPGAVPEMWRFHEAELESAVAETGAPSAELTAEHTALTLFAVHQQSQRQPMHRKGTGLGSALRRLSQSPQYKETPDALNARVNALATSADVLELAHHLRGLITLLRGIGQPLDYTQLHDDILAWHYPDGQARVRRRWGAQYYDWSKKSDQPA